MMASRKTEFEWLAPKPRQAAAWLRTFWQRFDARAASRIEARSAEERWIWGYAVRQDFADGYHFLDYFTVNRVRAERRATLLRHLRWLPSIRPVAVTVVAANRDHVRDHRRRPQFCTSPMCSTESGGWSGKNG